jgi:hypothetical protein
MEDQRKILIEYGTSSLDELLDIAANGIAAMIFANKNDQDGINQKERAIYENRIISG